MFAKACANPKTAAAIVGTIVGLLGAVVFSLAGWLNGETPTVGFIVAACLIGFAIEGGWAGVIAYFVFARIGEGDEKRKEHEKHRHKT